MQKMTRLSVFPLTLAAALAAAQELPPMAAEQQPAPVAKPATEVIEEPQASTADTPRQGTRELPQAEQLIRTGIMLQDRVRQILSGVNDADTAEAAVAPLMRTEAALQEWARSFNTLPPLSEEEQAAYEEAYIPIINRINNRIRVQGERLASAEYYGSRNLPAVLIRLALLNR